MGAFQAPTHGGDCTMPYGLKWEEVDVVHPKWRCDNLGSSVSDPHLRTRISHGLVLYTVREKKRAILKAPAFNTIILYLFPIVQIEEEILHACFRIRWLAVGNQMQLS